MFLAATSSGIRSAYVRTPVLISSSLLLLIHLFECHPDGLVDLRDLCVRLDFRKLLLLKRHFFLIVVQGSDKVTSATLVDCEDWLRYAFTRPVQNDRRIRAENRRGRRNDLAAVERECSPSGDGLLTRNPHLAVCEGSPNTVTKYQP